MTRDEAALRAALIDAVTLYRDAMPNSRQVCDGLNAIIKAAIALADSWLPSADDVRGILAEPYTGPERRVKHDPLVPQWEERRGRP